MLTPVIHVLLQRPLFLLLWNEQFNAGHRADILPSTEKVLTILHQPCPQQTKDLRMVVFSLDTFVIFTALLVEVILSFLLHWFSALFQYLPDPNIGDFLVLAPTSLYLLEIPITPGHSQDNHHSQENICMSASSMVV